MKIHKFIVDIDHTTESLVDFSIQKGYETINARLNKLTSAIEFNQKASFTELVQHNLIQIQKVVLSSLKAKVPIKKPIHFVLINQFPFLNHNDYLQYICIDQRKHLPLIYSKKEGTAVITKIFCDGSHAYLQNRSGFAGIIEYPDHTNEIYSATLAEKSNNYIELLAVIEGIKQIKSYKLFQINTDSRYVIRGLSQWVYFWKYNNWQTAFGTKVKFAELWQELDQLCQKKYIELKWIKGHSGNQYQDFCHCMAKELSSS